MWDFSIRHLVIFQSTKILVHDKDKHSREKNMSKKENTANENTARANYSSCTNYHDSTRNESPFCQASIY